MPPIPDFFDDFHLEDGEHECTFEDIEERFLFSDKRKDVWGKFRFLYDRLLALGLCPDYLLIDGSFVTGRLEPGDVDFGALIRPEMVRNAKRTLKDEAERDVIDIIVDSDKNQHLIRGLFGAHLLVADSDLGMEIISETFREGLIGELRDPDPERDPQWVKKPTAKGILKVNLGGEIDA